MPRHSLSKRLILLAFVAAGLLPLGLALLPTARVEAAGVVTDCSSPAGPNGLYTKLGGGGLVTFNCLGPGPKIITVSEIIPAGNTTVDGSNFGNPIILSGGGVNRIFQHWPIGGGLTLTHITLMNGSGGSDHGGCIYNNATVVLIDVTLTHCKVGTGAAGGAVYSRLPTNTLRLIDSRVISNSAVNGGGIWANGTIVISNSQVVDNYAAIYGGGVVVIGTAAISASQFLNNRAIYDGGGLFSSGALLSLFNATFNGNRADDSGGGLYNNGTAYVRNSSFSGNNAVSEGGGLHNSGAIHLSGVTAGGNYAYTGGGLFNFNSTALLTMTTLSNNRGVYCAGLQNRGDLKILTSTISSNQSENFGGGICTSNVATLQNVTLNGNSAGTHGGGIYGSGETGIDGLVVLRDVTLSNNHAGSLGGALVATDGFVDINGATLNNNSAAFGGGIYNYVDLTLLNVTLSGNSASSGGGLYNYGVARLRSVTLSGNSASSGAALYNYLSQPLLLTNTIVAYSPMGGNCGGTLTNAKYSIDSDNTCALGTMVGPGNLFADPLLTALGNYGGLTLVHMLKTGSPAINGVAGADAPPKDQRGLNRPVGAYDMGAVERQPGDSNLAPRLYLPLLRR